MFQTLDGAARAALWTMTAAGLAVALCAGAARAEEPHGCEAFKWPMKQETTLLQAPGKAAMRSGDPARTGVAVALALVDQTEAGLPTPPERAPKVTPAKAGFLRFAAPAVAASYQITVSEAAWIDVVQDGHTIKPSAFTGAADCPHVRKSLRVPLAATPFTVQVSGTQAASIEMLILPAPH